MVGTMAVTISIVADKADELSEALRKHATEKDGKIVVTGLPEGFAIEDVTGLKRTLQTEREARKAAEQALKPFQDAGLAADDLPKAVEAMEKIKTGALKNSAEIEAWKAEVLNKHSGEVKAVQTKLEKRTQALRERILQGALAPIIASKGGSESMDAILTLAMQNIRIEEDANGELVPAVVGRDGKALITKKAGSIDPMGFDELIDVMRDAAATKGLFKVQAAGGSGSSSQTGGAGRVAVSDSANLSPRELIARGNAQGAGAH